MAPKRKSLGIAAQIEREISDLDNQLARLGDKRNRLFAARAALDGQVVNPQITPRRISQDDVADYLAEHPRSTAAEIAAALGVRVVTVSAHLSRGQKAGRFVNDAGKWSLKE